MEALEVWLTADILDPVTGCSEWGEVSQCLCIHIAPRSALQVGLSSEGDVYVVVGYSREQPISYSELSFQELRECKVTQYTIVVGRESVGVCTGTLFPLFVVKHFGIL